VDSEARARDFSRAFEVQNAQFRAQIPMRFRSEGKRGRRAPAANFYVVLGALARRNRLVRSVRHAREKLAVAIVYPLCFFIQCGDPLTGFATLLLPLCSVL